MKNKKTLYALLIALFAIAVLYQARFTQRRFQFLFQDTEAVAFPINTPQLNTTIVYVGPEAAEAGVQKGDRLLSVNGQPFTGLKVLYDAVARSKIGDPITIRFDRDGTGPQEVTIHIPEYKYEAQSVGGWIFVIVFSGIMPFFCLLVGFWVATIRPTDPMAWLLLALMLSFSQLATGFDPVALNGWLRDAAIVYRTSFWQTWPVWMLLFGIYFSERFIYDKRWPWAKWILIAPQLLYTVGIIIVQIGIYENFSAVASLDRLLDRLDVVQTGVAMTSVGVFFLCMGMKMGMATQIDTRRRLRLLLIGASVSLTPIFLMLIYSLARGKEMFQGTPLWLGLLILLPLLFFPLTLAYSIVVYRAMDVRVVIRQGLQYGLARGGIVALQFLLLMTILFVMIWKIKQPDARAIDIAIIIGIGVTLIFTMRRLGERLAAWLDRRFFREAYNAEQILSDLSENVRSMVETRPLIETVAERISESLHVPRIALFMQNDGAYRAAHTLGYENTVELSFDERAATVEQLKKEKEPVRIYLDDANSWIHTTPGVDGEREILAALDAQLLLPLAVKEKLPGFISLGPKQSEEPYSNSDLRLLRSVATQTGLALENSQLTERIASEVAQRERLNREVEIAREVQERLFPQKLPLILGLDYCGACRPALGVGGDYYDFLLLPNGALGIAIGDVSGKGIAAALLMASLQASLRGQAIKGASDLAEMMGNINALVYDASAENRYATFFYAQYEPATRSLAYVNAGHNPPVVLRKQNGEWQILRLEAGGAVVGLLRNFPYGKASVTLEPDDLLVAFTDGISEAMNTAEEEWGEEELIETAKACEGLSAAETLSRIVEAADRFAAGAKQHDDMTMLVARVAG